MKKLLMLLVLLVGLSTTTHAVTISVELEVPQEIIDAGALNYLRLLMGGLHK